MNFEQKFYNTNSPEQIKFEYLEEDILNSSILKNNFEKTTLNSLNETCA